MPSRHVFLTFVVVLLGMGLAPLLPKNVKLRPTAISQELPTFVGDWFGTTLSVSQRELDVLAKDTVFSRAQYTDSRDNAVVASIVISGHDLNSSIHRPERCLPAQGWTVNKSEKGQMNVPGLSINPFPYTKLENYAFMEIPPSPEYPQGATGRRYNITRYFFIGAETITRSHDVRTYRDMVERVFLGQSQQWAYVTFSVDYGIGPARQVIVPNVEMSAEDREKLEKQIEAERQAADKALQAFMAEILPELLPKWRAALAAK
jgi:hypothetical protein